MEHLDKALHEVTTEYEALRRHALSAETSRTMRDDAQKEWAEGVRRAQTAIAAAAAALVMLSWWWAGRPRRNRAWGTRGTEGRCRSS